jgi:hypothetical protein
LKFSIILYTNQENNIIDHNINTLKRCIHGDEIIILNYSRYHNKYRRFNDIAYHQFNKNLFVAIDTVLHRYSKHDNIILISPSIRLTRKTLKGIKQNYKDNQIASCKVNTITNNNVVLQDTRIGSFIKPSYFDKNFLIFNKVKTGLFNNQSIKNFCKRTNVFDLKIFNDVIVYNVNPNPKENITILLPSTHSTLIPYIKKIKKEFDSFYTFNMGERTAYLHLNKYIKNSKNEIIVLINPYTKIFDKNILNDARSTPLDTVFIFDSNNVYNNNTLTNDCIISFNKKNFQENNFQLKKCVDVQKHLCFNKKIQYFSYQPQKEIIEKKVFDKNKNSYSIIIPFMYNGDRWSLFKASIEELYNHTKQHNNIEIIIHETAPERFLTDDFINQYGIEYIFSEWSDYFHRGWSLNVAAKYKAKGNMLVFFDADLIITKQWVNELLSCNKYDIKIGWGKMYNLTKNATKHYLRTKQIIRDFDRVRRPSAHGAGGGINVIPKQVFFDIKGWPEENNKGYGFEDNAMNFKLETLGYI